MVPVSGERRGKQAWHREGVEQNKLVAKFEATCLDQDPVAVETSREQPSFAPLIGPVYRKWRFDQFCITSLADKARQADQVTVSMDLLASRNARMRSSNTARLSQ